MTLYPGAERLRDKEVDHLAALEAAGEFFLSGELRRENAMALRARMLRVGGRYAGEVKKPTFVLTINSGGGSVREMLFLAGVFRRIQNEMGIRITTYVCGVAYSAALTVAQYGSHRLVDTYRTVLAHSISYGAVGTHLDVLDVARVGEIQQRIVARILAERNTAGHTNREYWLEKYFTGRDTYLTREEALAEGLFDEIVS